jgi:hypothetical protein
MPIVGAIKTGKRAANRSAKASTKNRLVPSGK